MSLPRYERYKPSEIEWLEEVPEHWHLKKLKHTCRLFPSNVDKKSYEDQQPVKLCNYTDVYYNERISGNFDFMQATATPEQIEKFTLRAGDTIITKDSETADDIAISAFVPDDLPGVICGYHLAIVRPLTGMFGVYVKRFFDCKFARASFEVRANGLTRFGLSQYALDNVVMTVPPNAEQVQIAIFLDREAAKIDALVEEQKRLIELLKEKRQAVITHAVTKGLNRNAPMRPSGVEWLGDVPEHWEVGPVKNFFEFLDGRRVPLSSEERAERSGPFPYYGASGIIDYVDDHLFDEDLVLVSEDGANLINRSTPIAFVATGKYWVNNHAHILRPMDRSLTFWSERLEVLDLAPLVTGAAQPKLTIDALANIRISVPRTETERRSIGEFIAEATRSLDALTGEAVHAVNLLLERRSALISAAVTEPARQI